MDPFDVDGMSGSGSGDGVESAREFLEWRWGRSGSEISGEGWLTLCSRAGGAGSKMVVEGAYPVEDIGLDELAAKAVALSDSGADTWVLLNGLGGKPPVGRKGGEVGLRWLVGLHEDIDKGVDDPLGMLDGLGDYRPSYVVDSGHGVHAYWLFDQPVDLLDAAGGEVEKLHEIRGWYRMLAGRWHRWLESESVGGAVFDDCTNLDRIMRLPGTSNHKRSGVKPVLVARPFDGRTFHARDLWMKLTEWGMPETVSFGGGGSRVLSATEAASAFAKQGTLEGSEAVGLIERLIPIYVHRANTYNNASRSRNRAMFDLVQQLNDHGVAREDAVDAVLRARGLVSEYTESQEHDPLTVEEVMTVVESAYQYPPRGAAASPDAVAVPDAVASWAAGLSDGGGGGGGFHVEAVESGGGGSGGSGLGGGGGSGEGGEDEILHRVSDAANGEDLVRLMSGELCKVEGVGWHLWDGVRWRVDGEGSNRKLPRARRKMVAEFRKNAEDEDLDIDERKAWAARIARLESDAGMPAAFRAAGPDMLVEYGDMDADPWLLNFPNGTVDLRTGELREHRAEDRITRVCAADYVAGAKHEIWDQVINHAVRGDEDAGFLRRWFGSSCTGVVSEKAILLVSGPADSGKTTLTEAISEALGNVKETGGYSWQWSNSMIEKDEQGDSVGTALSDTLGARLVVVAELNEGARLRAGFVKSSTGGDRVNARMLYQQGFSYAPEFKMVVHTNHVPKTHDDALQRRLRLFKTVRTLEAKDPRIGDAVKHDVEVHEAVLAWLVQGAREWYEAGQISGYPSMQDDSMHELASASDQIYAFLADCYETKAIEDIAPAEDVLERRVEWFVTRQQSWIDYSEWHRYNEEMGRKLGQRQLIGKLRERGFDEGRKTINGKQTRVLYGLRRRSEMGVEMPVGWDVLDGGGGGAGGVNI